MYHVCTQVRGLPRGYHLLRAFLFNSDGKDGYVCMKSPVAYVEAEFFTVEANLPERRCVCLSVYLSFYLCVCVSACISV